MQLKQVLANGKKRALSVGAVNIFTKKIGNNTTAPGKQILTKIKERIGFQKYCPTEKDILLIGTIPSQEYSKVTFPVLSLDPVTKKDVRFQKGT